RETSEAYSALHHKEPDGRRLFRLIFRLLAAKLLDDRRHGNQDWTAGSPNDIVTRVEQFYLPDEGGPVPAALSDAEAVAVAWRTISQGFHLQNVSLDSLAWIWENTLVTPEARRVLGIHGTPAEVAEYIVRKL